jgi:exonuclease VII small subunit
MALELETIIQVGAIRVANLDNLKVELEIALKEFKSMPLVKENISNLKDARARLKKASEGFNKRRIELGKAYAKPFEVFKVDVDGIIEMIQDVIGPIDDELKRFENDDKEEKQFLIKEMFNKHFKDSLVPFEKYWDERYLNYTFSLLQVEQDLYKKFNEWHNNLVIIDKLDLSMQDKVDLKSHYLMTLNLNDSIDYINKRNAVIQQLQSDKPSESEIVFQVIGSKEELLKLSQFLKDHKYNYKRLK